MSETRTCDRCGMTAWASEPGAPRYNYVLQSTLCGDCEAEAAAEVTEEDDL